MSFYKYPELEVTSLGFGQLVENNKQAKDIQFTIIQNRKKLQILTFEKLLPVNIWHFCLINDLYFQMIINIVDLIFCSRTNGLVDFLLEL